jgi:origin recognition complex subunit 5
VISPFVQDPDEMAYIAAARWPGFVQPLLDEHFRVRAEREAERAAHDEDAGVDLEEQEGDMWPPAPSEETRVRLLRHFTPTFTTALEQLYPRHTDAKTWAMQAAAEDTSVPPADGTADETALVHALPRLHKFIMLATYLASTNPAKSDYRIFGRLTDGKGKKKKGGGTRKTRIGSKAGVNKVRRRRVFATSSADLAASGSAAFLGADPIPARSSSRHSWCTLRGARSRCASELQ